MKTAGALVGLGLLGAAGSALADPPLPVDELPPGFTTAAHARAGVVGAGIALLGGSWSLATLPAVALESDAEPGNDDEVWPLFVPVAGPFIAMGLYDEGDPGLARALLFANGLSQVGGLAMIIAGVTLTETVIVPTAGGLAVRGSF